MKKLSIYIITLIMFVSCADTLDDIEDPIVEEGDAYITLTVQVPGVKAPTSYSSITEAQENLILDLDILAFINNGQEDVLSYHLYVSRDSITDVNEGANIKRISLPLKRMAQPVRLMILANSRTAINKMNNNNILVEGTPAELIRDSLTFDPRRFQNLDSFQGFPMYGQTQTYIATNTQQLPEIGTVSLLRSLAKIEIGVDMYGDPALGFGSMFEVDSVYIFRATDIGYVSPHSSELSKKQVSRTNIPETATFLESPFRYKYDASLDPIYNITSMHRQIYIPEAEACVSGQEDKATCLVIRAKYDKGAYYYYRVDFMDNQGKYLPIWRNYRYLINISSIKGTGYPTAQEAANSKSSSLTYEIKIQNDNINDIVFNNQNMLGVSKSKVSIGWQEGSKTSIKVLTDYDLGWSVLRKPDWLETEEVYSSADKQEGELIIKVKDVVYTTYSRTGTIILAAGALQKEICVNHTLGANSYIVHPDTSYIRFPVASANADGVIRVDNGLQYKTVILWDDREVGPIGYGWGRPGYTGHVSFWPYGREGNVVVGIIDNNNKVIWSWHIWITSIDFENEANQYMNNGFTFMDRNLGATSKVINSNNSYGLLYQWGRREPFLGALGPESNGEITGKVGRYMEDASIIYDDTTLIGRVFEERRIIIEPVQYANNLDTAFVYPYTFYTAERAPYNWAGTSMLINTLWMDTNGEKGPYDPCPQGWRVPPLETADGSPWSGLNPSGLYPKAGGRMYDSGKFADVGSAGYVWTASPRTTEAYVMSFTGNSFNTQTAFRANAYSIRCMKEE